MYDGCCSCQCLQCICVFPGCWLLTPVGLGYISYFTELEVLVLQKLLRYDIIGQGGSWGWIQGLPKTMTVLVITGELPRHIHNDDISTALTELAVTSRTGLDFMLTPDNVTPRPF